MRGQHVDSNWERPHSAMCTRDAEKVKNEVHSARVEKKEDMEGIPFTLLVLSASRGLINSSP